MIARSLTALLTALMGVPLAAGIARAGDELKPGDEAPDVALPLDDGTTIRTAGLGVPLVLYFFPKDDTPG